MSEHLVRPFIVLENSKTGEERIKLTEGSYAGIIFSYGKVTFDEQGDICNLRFEYDVHDDANIPYVKEELEQYLGDMLQFIIMEQLQKNEIIYTGGIDENRTTDSEPTDL